MNKKNTQTLKPRHLFSCRPALLERRTIRAGQSVAERAQLFAMLDGL